MAAHEFKQLFGQRVPRGWRTAWLNRFNATLSTESDARSAAHDFARYSVATAKARATQTLKAHGADPTARPWSLDELKRLPPVASLLFMYLVGEHNDTPFVLDGEDEELVVPKHKKDMKLWRNVKTMRLLNNHDLEILDHQNRRHVVQYTTKWERVRTGEKWDRTGDAGAVPDVTTLDGFIIAQFECLAYDAGPAEPLAIHAGATRRYLSFYATDRELAVLSVIMDPTAVAVSPDDIANGTSVAVLLDQHRHKLTNKRKRSGYLWSTANQQVLFERSHQSMGGLQASRAPGDPQKVTPAEQREWIDRQMSRPAVTPIIPWPT